MEKQPIFGLVCAGGGAHGAYQVGVLKYIHEKFSSGKESPFQVFSGSSCGSLNTSFYAAQSFDAHASRLWLEDLWLHFHVTEYHGNLFKNIFLTGWDRLRKRNHDNTKQAWSLLDPKPMQDVIRKGFLRPNLERSLLEGSTLGIAVAATELISGRTCWFLEGPRANAWNLFHSIGLIDSIYPHHIEASCSVPVFLPPVRIHDRFYLDGTISLDRPLSPAISMGATRILSIATDKPGSKELPKYEPRFFPTLADTIRLLLNRVGYDASQDEADQIEALNRFHDALPFKKSQENSQTNFPLFHKEGSPTDYKKTEVFLFYPSRRIRFTSGITEDESGSRESRSRSRFMFHEKFIRKLINLGYDDAKAKHQELKTFFFPESAKKRWLFFPVLSRSKPQAKAPQFKEEVHQ